MTECTHCGNVHKAKCPMVKAIEYFENGMVKRVEYITPADLSSPPIPLPMSPAWLPPISSLRIWDGSKVWGPLT